MSKPTKGMIVTMAVLMLGAACSDSSPTAEEPEAQLVVSALRGSGQVAAPQEVLGDSLEASVRKVGVGPSAPAPGVSVCWHGLTQGVGNPAGSCTLTDSNGLARVGWTSGTVAGEHQVEARVDGVDPAGFTFTIRPGSAASVDAELGKPSTLRAAKWLFVQNHLEISGGRDRWGNAIPVADVEAEVLALDESQVRWEFMDTESSSVGPEGSGWNVLGEDVGQRGYEPTGSASIKCDGSLRSQAEEADGVPGLQIRQYTVRLALRLLLDGRDEVIESPTFMIMTPSDATQIAECGEVVF